MERSAQRQLTCLLRTILAVLLWTSFAGATARADTSASHVRGAAYDGHFNDTVITLPWPASGPSILWRRQIADGLSGVIIANDRVYTQIQTLSGQYVLCLDLKTGRELWRTRYNWPWQPEGSWPGPYGSPTYRDGRVFFTDCYGRAGCVEAIHGRLLWLVDLAKEAGVTIPEFGYAATPLVHDNTVYLPVGGTNAAVLALRATDGAIRWRQGDAAGSYSSCVWVQVHGEPQVIAFLDGVALGLAPATGAKLWRHEWPSETTPNATWPLYEEPYLFHSLPFHRGGRTLRLTTAESGSPAEIVWNKKVLSMEILPGAIVHGQIYGFDLRDFEAASDGVTRGVFKCIDLVTGRERWRTNSVGQCAILVCGERLLLLNERGALIVAEADPHGYRELARCRLFDDQRCWSPPAVAGNLLVARSRQDFVCIDLASPADGSNPARLDATLVEPSLVRLWRWVGAWFGGRYAKCFYAPMLRDQSRWLAACLGGVLIPAWILGCLFPAGSRRHAAFAVATVGLGFASTWVWTMACGKFVFTWPAAVFGSLHLALMCRDWAVRAGTTRHLMLARAGLLAFAALAVGYWFLCRSLFFVVGGGYLVGLLPALPLCVVAASASSGPNRPRTALRSLALLALAFAVQFSASAIFIRWRT